MKQTKPVETKFQAPKADPTVKHMQVHASIELMGNGMSYHAKDADMYELVGVGILVVSKKTKRKMVVPFSNIRGYELL